MTTQTVKRASQDTITEPKREQNPKRKGSREHIFWILLGAGFLFFVYLLASGESEASSSPITIDESGNVKLTPEREAKMRREIEEIENAEQYALIAAISKHFPCYSCVNGVNILFLNKGEVWKYGVTRKGERIRYPGGHYGATDLIYVQQYKGNYAECLKKEKLKIYEYPLLPEARRRSTILPRPPGNKNDN